MQNDTQLPALIGADLQGGRYAGCMVEDGKLVHLIAAPESLGRLAWKEANEAASEYRGGGHDDWRLPTKAELQCVQAQAPELLEKEWQWTSTPPGSSHAWVVDFESGLVNVGHRTSEFAARPFRRLSL